MLASTLAFSKTATSAECQGIQFADTADVDGQSLVLNGLGIRKATFLKVKVYVAGLYVPQTSKSAEDILSKDQAWRLRLVFVRDVDASDIREAWQDGFESNAGSKVTALQKRIEMLNGWMTDFEEGQSLTFEYRPGKEIKVKINDASKGSIEGADFASGLLSIWLGPEPPNDDIKAGLLGASCG